MRIVSGKMEEKQISLSLKRHKLVYEPTPRPLTVESDLNISKGSILNSPCMTLLSHRHDFAIVVSSPTYYPP